MKIAFIAYDSPGYRGGPIINARRLLPELQRNGHEVHALIQYRRGGAPTADILRMQDIIVHSSVYHNWIEDQIEWILNRVIEIQPDVFIPNISVAGWYASRWIRKAGIPTICAYRSDDAFYAAMVEKFVLGDPQWAVSGMVSVNQSAYERVLSKDPKRTKLCVIPSGVPIPKTYARQLKEPLKIVYVGRLVQEQKRIKETIDSLASVLRELPKSTATLIGHTGGDFDEFALKERILSHKLDDRLNYLGTVEPEDLAYELKKYNVIVLLSDYEGTPGSIMDGMASGLVPVCLNRSDGIRELVKHEETGLLVTDREQSFISALIRLDEDVDLRQKLSSNARRHIENGYSLQVSTSRWISFCERLINDEAESKIKIQKPNSYDLPPINPSLAREDKRKPKILKLILWQCIQYKNILVSKVKKTYKITKHILIHNF